MPIEGKSHAAKARAAYDLYLLGYAREGQPSNGDLVIQECEAQAKLRPHNFEWPYWRTVTARLRKAAKEKEQGDGVPADEDAEDADPEADEPDQDAPVDLLAQMDAENQKLRTELDAARQSFRSERAAREELQDALHWLRADITRVLSVSEKAVWDATAPKPEPLTPDPEPPRTFGEAITLIHRRNQPETCETITEALDSVSLQDGVSMAA